MIHVVLSLSA